MSCSIKICCIFWEHLPLPTFAYRHRQFSASMAGAKFDHVDWHICSGGGICYYLVLSPRHCRYTTEHCTVNRHTVQRQQTHFNASIIAGNAPRWVYYFNGFSVFWYLHLDCLDGKQARRTKSSSPLGQLFDHGNTATARSYQ